ncbi:MAG: hypothetical protein V4510_09960 [bacterium]
MTTKKATKATPDHHDEYETENSPYLLEGAKIVRNYALLRGTPVDNNLILDYITCNDADEAKRIRGWLWNAFAGGRSFEKAEAKKSSILQALRLLVEADDVDLPSRMKGPMDIARAAIARAEVR